jgi:hypothetical protein
MWTECPTGASCYGEVEGSTPPPGQSASATFIDPGYMAEFSAEAGMSWTAFQGGFDGFFSQLVSGNLTPISIDGRTGFEQSGSGFPATSDAYGNGNVQLAGAWVLPWIGWEALKWGGAAIIFLYGAGQIWLQENNEGSGAGEAPPRSVPDRGRDLEDNPQDWDRIEERPDPRQPPGGESVREIWKNKVTGEKIGRHRMTPPGMTRRGNPKHPHFFEP